MSVRRNHKNLPVYIVEDHCDALAHIYRNIGSGHLPFQDNLLIHFDSHPDLLVDKDLEADVAYDKEKLLDSLSIENWILPGCFSGQFSKVCWLKPHWSSQIPEGSHSILIGKHDGKIRLGSDLYYYMSDGIFEDRNELSDKRQFELSVVEWPNAQDKSTCIRKILPDQVPYILDIDLDFFSTKNPFLELFGKGGLYESLGPIFSLTKDDNCNYQKNVMLAAKHKTRLRLLEDIFSYLDENFSLDGFPKELPGTLREHISQLTSAVAKHYDPFAFDWKLLLNAGMTCDEVPLPHHVSSSEELSEGLRTFREFLEVLPCRPTIVTIARSSDDDYCPKEQVELIQKSVLGSLEAVFGVLSITKDYENSQEQENLGGTVSTAEID